MKVNNVFLVDVVRGGSETKIPLGTDFGIRVRLELEGDQAFLKGMVDQLNAGRVTVIGLLNHQEGTKATMDAALVFSLPR